MLTNVCIKVEVVDQELHDYYFVSYEFEKRLYCLWNKQYNDNCDQAYLGVGIFDGKVKLAIYNME